MVFSSFLSPASLTNITLQTERRVGGEARAVAAVGGERSVGAVGAAAGAAAARAVEDLLLPLVDVEVDVLPLLCVGRPGARRLGEPQLEVLVVSPVAIVELRRGVGLLGLGLGLGLGSGLG